MPIVRFLPADIAVDVPPGTLIHEAAILAGIETLHLPCGGKGTCGQCLVEVVAGQGDQTGRSHLDEALARKGLVMACRTRVRDDITVRLRASHAAAMQVVGESHMLVSEECLPDATSLSPLVRAVHLTVPPASIEEHYSDWQRLVRALGGDLPVTTGTQVLRGLAEAVRAPNPPVPFPRGEEGAVTVVLRERDAGLHVTAVHPGHIDVPLHGLAIDIGTTTVAVQLVDLRDGRVLASRTSYNGQISRGADVISRIDYARTPERLAELRGLVLDTVNRLVADICSPLPLLGAGLGVSAAFVAGNTTMVHLLLGLPPRYIREAPYVPTVNAAPMLTAAEVGLAIAPDAVVGFAPSVGSYVGGDITAGLLCTELLTNHEDVFLFLDIGTNGEIVLGNADWKVACACSAGPAFEGSGIKCGMRATEGAIEHVEISPDGRDVSFDVIGGGKPAGVCGSGLIALLGELLVRGIVDQMGRFRMDLGSERLVQSGGARGFVVAWAGETRDGHDLTITEPDIENLMRTKAAIYAACSLILRNVGLTWDAVSRVIIAGGFGRYIQVDDAVQIGLLPDLPEDRFAYIGNASFTGAYIALLSAERRRDLAAVAAGMTYVDLGSDPQYMDSYVSAMFLPHTNMAEFPSVAARLCASRDDG